MWFERRSKLLTALVSSTVILCSCSSERQSRESQRKGLTKSSVYPDVSFSIWHWRSVWLDSGDWFWSQVPKKSWGNQNGQFVLTRSKIWGWVWLRQLATVRYMYMSSLCCLISLGFKTLPIWSFNPPASRSAYFPDLSMHRCDTVCTRIMLLSVIMHHINQSRCLMSENYTFRFEDGIRHKYGRTRRVFSRIFSLSK